MIACIQRVTEAKVTVANATVGAISHGLLVLAALQTGDTDTQLDWVARKLPTMRIFRSPDGTKHFDLDVTQVNGGILLVSQFTLAADTSQSRRPSLSGAMPPAEAEAAFERFVSKVRAAAPNTNIQTGRFAADMRVHLINDGPVTFLLDTTDLTAR